MYDVILVNLHDVLLGLMFKSLSVSAIFLCDCYIVWYNYTNCSQYGYWYLLNQDNATPLIWAAFGGHASVAKLLIDANADIDYSNSVSLSAKLINCNILRFYPLFASLPLPICFPCLCDALVYCTSGLFRDVDGCSVVINIIVINNDYGISYILLLTFFERANHRVIRCLHWVRLTWQLSAQLLAEIMRQWWHYC